VQGTKENVVPERNLEADAAFLQGWRPPSSAFPRHRTGARMDLDAFHEWLNFGSWSTRIGLASTQVALNTHLI